MEALTASLTELYARAPRGMQLGLERMQLACKKLGHPERSFECVHIAGTNGKGSVSAMVSSIAKAMGRRTGLYTSPHLSRFAERIRVDGDPIDEALLQKSLREALACDETLSFFEVATLAAFLSFQKLNIDIAVLEVGIGGRLDATNVIPPSRASAITRIAFDHTEMLGSTLPAIAAEKAGILKEGAPCVIGPVSREVRDVFERASKTLHFIEDEPLRSKLDTFMPSAKPALRGSYQKINARIATAVGWQLGADDQQVREGLAAAQWPGRFEKLEVDDGAYLLDAAHNLDGVAALLESIREENLTIDALIFGTMADKNSLEMLSLLKPLCAHRFYVPPQGRKATPPDNFLHVAEGTICSSFEDANARARSLLGRDARLLICGSIYLIGEARAHLLHEERDPPIAL